MESEADDIEVREFTSGKSRQAAAAALGFKFEVTPKLDLVDGISATRLLLPRCWFDGERGKVLIEALTQYRKTWNERLQQFTDSPVHDWTSHPAGAVRGLAVRHQPPDAQKHKQPPPPFSARGPTGTGWMA